MADSKHLEFLQAVIARMGANGFLAKGWSVTLGTAALGFAVKESQAPFALIGLLPVTVFWVLDGYYLALERGFRILFEAAAADYIAKKPPSFVMEPTAAGLADTAGAMVRPAVWLVHVPILAVLGVAAYRLSGCP